MEKDEKLLKTIPQNDSTKPFHKTIPQNDSTKPFHKTIPPVVSRPGRLVGSNVQLSVKLSLLSYVLHHFTVHRGMISFVYGTAAM
jgi:hypothetical protein